MVVEEMIMNNIEQYLQDYNFKKELQKITETLLLKNCTIIMIETRNEKQIKFSSVFVSFVEEEDGRYCFYNYNGDKVFEYDGDEKVRVYVVNNLCLEMTGSELTYPPLWIEWFVKNYVEETNVEDIAEKLFMSDESKSLLEKYVNDECGGGCPNPTLYKQLEHLSF